MWCSLCWDSKACQQMCDFINQWSHIWLGNKSTNSYNSAVEWNILELWIKLSLIMFSLYTLILGTFCTWEDMTNKNAHWGTLSWDEWQLPWKKERMNQKANWKTTRLKKMENRSKDADGKVLCVLDRNRIPRRGLGWDTRNECSHMFRHKHSF